MPLIDMDSIVDQYSVTSSHNQEVRDIVLKRDSEVKNKSILQVGEYPVAVIRNGYNDVAYICDYTKLFGEPRFSLHIFFASGLVMDYSLSEKPENIVSYMVAKDLYNEQAFKKDANFLIKFMEDSVDRYYDEHENLIFAGEASNPKNKEINEKIYKALFETNEAAAKAILGPEFTVNKPHMDNWGDYIRGMQIGILGYGSIFLFYRGDFKGSSIKKTILNETPDSLGYHINDDYFNTDYKIGSNENAEHTINNLKEFDFYSFILSLKEKTERKQKLDQELYEYDYRLPDYPLSISKNINEYKKLITNMKIHLPEGDEEFSISTAKANVIYHISRQLSDAVSDIYQMHVYNSTKKAFVKNIKEKSPSPENDFRNYKFMSGENLLNLGFHHALLELVLKNGKTLLILVVDVSKVVNQPYFFLSEMDKYGHPEIYENTDNIIEYISHIESRKSDNIAEKDKKRIVNFIINYMEKRVAAFYDSD